jgi:NADPH:quinone reductase-like Zn-dependent oxidoreductase
MKAIQMDQYGGEDQLKMVDVTQPKAAKGQVVVRVLATTLNPLDLKRTSGKLRQVLPIQLPFIPGSDFSGVVDSVGEGVKDFKVGDEVFGYPSSGAYAEYLAIDASKIALKPKKLNHVEAASLGLAGQAALQMVDRAGVQKGQTVLVQGAAGAVGGIAVQLAHHRGAKVIGTATGPSIRRAKDYGAAEVIDFKTERFEDRVKDVDVVLDAVGGDALPRSFAVLKRGGTLVTIVEPPPEDEAAKHNVKASLVVTESSTASLKTIAQMADAGEIKPYVGKVYSLSEVAKGWEAGQSGQVDGKIVFKVAAEATRSASAQ